MVFGDIGDRRSQRIVLDYTTAFFERFLKGRHRPLLDRPSPAYPEVECRSLRMTSFPPRPK
ncbi:hypothetical protein FKR81_18840 [Lentzea tibetensis]|uniref:Uncharacterized protein n=1 Tax=Lentzea tibetensis TaxID=2591470 RepID=A0A563ET51_9PSEU|nr:hypothetical protein [Lentzea tibetensis]TWP50671.1 hypothetical protein FKR81_18840 [Lentzea tibetensis]